MVRSPSPARGGDRDVQAAQGLDGLLKDLLGAFEVGHVHLVEGFADGVGDFLALGLRPVQDGHAGATLGQRLGGCLAEPGRPADDDGLLPAISIWLPFQKVLNS